ncbi:MAG TPA: tRNA 2-thiouridine(34) synthase MnmA [Patescibacteria group bacterium]|nr:tRNA 2-thiouridine(34) synthase MnmA [Patescibacteria group bacterium]
MKKEKRNKEIKVAVAMSGGVDSSAAAALLKKQGYEVIGVFMKFWKEAGQGENRCCSSESENRARKVAKILDIPFYVFNFEKEFKKRVVDRFLDGYEKGITPNPCVVCNKEIKFGLLIEKALASGADFIATGHYARKKQAKGKDGKMEYKLYRGKDKKKDQSYFLWQLNQKQLEKIILPVGDYQKSQVRNLAKKFRLPVSGIAESMEICFIPGKLEDFLKKRIKTKPGPILLADNKKIIGCHQGLPLYTIGQRKGIELSGGPYYVVKKDEKKNTLVVASVLKDEALWSKILKVRKINWLSGRKPKQNLKIKIQIRYGQEPVAAIFNRFLKLQTRQRAITPGQSAVFYRGKELLGGGIIS